MTLKDIYTQSEKHIKLFVRGKGKVVSKFVSDVLMGILSSKSVMISEIARNLEGKSKTSARHIYKRLNRCIGDYNIEDVVERVKRYQGNMIDDDTLIFIDGSEVVKKYGKKFECLSRVADGSDNRIIKKGYPIIGAIGLKGNEIIPVSLKIYSHKSEEFGSETRETLELVEDIAVRCRGRGICVIDRGGDEFVTIRKAGELDMRYIIRMGENRKYYLYGKRLISYERDEVIREHKEIEVKSWIEVREKKKLVTKLFTISGVRVELLGGRIESKKAIWLIRAKSKGLTLYLLSNIEIINKESLVYIVKGYLSRWKIEEYYRFIKQEYKLERFLVRDMGRIKNLINLLFIAVVILCRISEFKIEISKVRDILIKKSKRVYKIPQKIRFLLYMLGDGLSEVLKIIIKRLRQITSREKKVNKNQLLLSFAEDL